MSPDWRSTHAYLSLIDALGGRTSSRQMSVRAGEHLLLPLVGGCDWRSLTPFGDMSTMGDAESLGTYVRRLAQRDHLRDQVSGIFLSLVRIAAYLSGGGSTRQP
jgi:hypothetical protein